MDATKNHENPETKKRRNAIPWGLRTSDGVVCLPSSLIRLTSSSGSCFCFLSASHEVGRLKFDEYKSREDLIRRIRTAVLRSALFLLFLLYGFVVSLLRLVTNLCLIPPLLHCDTPSHFVPFPGVDWIFTFAGRVLQLPGPGQWERGLVLPFASATRLLRAPISEETRMGRVSFLFHCATFVKGLAFFFTRRRPLRNSCTKE